MADIVAALVLSATVSTAPACEPGRPLTPCEAQILTDAQVWRKRAHVTRVRFEGCAEKLAIRSSSVAQTLMPCPKTEQGADDYERVTIFAVGSLLLGLVFGLIL